MPTLFHLLVISIYRISTAAIEKLLLLSLQFLLKRNKIKKRFSLHPKLPSKEKFCKGNLQEKSLPTSCVQTYCNMLSLIKHTQQRANKPAFIKCSYLNGTGPNPEYFN